MIYSNQWKCIIHDDGNIIHSASSKLNIHINFWFKCFISSGSVYLIDTKSEPRGREYPAKLYKKDGAEQDCDVFVSVNIRLMRYKT